MGIVSTQAALILFNISWTLSLDKNIDKVIVVSVNSGKSLCLQLRTGKGLPGMLSFRKCRSWIFSWLLVDFVKEKMPNYCAWLRAVSDLVEFQMALTIAI